MNIRIEIASESSAWNHHPEINNQLFSSLVTNILSRYPNLAALDEVELSILLTNNEAMKKLNQEFRQNNKPTNVLSFPDIEIDWRKIVEFQPEANYMYLGDISFGYDIIKSEALDKDIDFQDHFIHLATHAILHLLGYDHITEEEAIVMENIEIEMMKILGIKSPY